MWWTYVVGILVIAFVIYAFISVARGRTRSLSRKTSRTAEDMYDRYADTPATHHQHGGSGPDGSGDGLLGGPAPPRR